MFILIFAGSLVFAVVGMRDVARICREAAE
jgi:hypothetical protein